MNCPACGAENREGAKFCGSCRQPIGAPQRCAACGAANPPAQRYCDECGEALTAAPSAPPVTTLPAPDRTPRAYTPKHLADKILASRAALEGERKQVTVLFADVRGSMELAERVDAEQWHAILDRFFAILTDGVHRFEGTVNQYTGDGIMALFGAPLAHEDHAQRACYAALHLREALRAWSEELKRTRGLAFATRIGINSGEVVVGKIGDDLRMDYTAQGHTVGLAQRMESLADPGRVYVADATAKLVSGYFALRDLGEFTLKGVREPVRVHELEGTGALRTRFDRSRARGLTRFVGRTSELAGLEAALARAETGEPQVIGIVADPGTGKSRLCFELLERARARGVAVQSAHGVPHGKGLSYLPMLELYRESFGIADCDTPALAREKIAGRLVLLDESFRDALPVLFDFLGVAEASQPALGIDPDVRQRLIAGVMRRMIELRSRREVTLTLLEDLHWFDPASDALLAALAEPREGARTLLLATLRPEYHAAWMDKSFYQQLPLRPLGAEAVAELLRELLGTDASLAPLAAFARERTGGNPFFLEELVLSLAESGALVGTRGAYRLARPLGEIEVPATVQAILAARIDRLAEREKRVLQSASAIGRELAEPLLRAVAELPEAELAASLAALVAAELLVEASLYPVREYAFKHALTRDVAYGSMLSERRARLHAAVACALEASSPAEPGEHAALLAHHYDAAGLALEAARWHLRAAEWAARSNLEEVRRHAERARALVRALPASAERDELGVEACSQGLSSGARTGMSREEAESLLEEGRLFAGANRRARGVLQIRFGSFQINGLADWRGLAGALRALIREATEAGDVVLRVAAQASLLPALTTLGPASQALELCDDTLAAPPDQLAEALRLADTTLAAVVGVRSSLLGIAGRQREQRIESERAVALAAAASDRGFARHSVLSWRTNALLRAGDAAAAAAAAREMIPLSDAMGAPAQIVWPRVWLGQSYLLLGRAADALVEFEEALRVVRATGAVRQAEPSIWSRVADAHRLLGDGGRAENAAREGVRASRVAGGLNEEILSRVALARALVARGGGSFAADVEGELAVCEELIRETEFVGNLPLVHIARAELARALGDEAGRERELREAHRLFLEMGADGHAERLARELAS